ncbi:MAG: GAF domain-containing protein [Caldisericia bacterium]
MIFGVSIIIGLLIIFLLVRKMTRNIARMRQDTVLLTELHNNVLVQKHRGKIYQSILKTCKQISGSERVLLMLYDDNEHNLRVVSAIGTEQNPCEHRFLVGEGMAGKVYISKKVTYVPDIRSCPDYITLPSEELSADSMLLVPLIYQSRCIGLLCFVSSIKKTFRQDDFITETLAASVSQIIISVIPNKDTNVSANGLYEPWYFEQHLSMLIRQFLRTTIPFGLLIIAIKNIKEISEKNGHETGNTMMKEFADAILPLQRGTDISSNYKNGKFIVLCYGTEPAELDVVANRFYKRIPKKINEIPLDIVFLYLHYPTDTEIVSPARFTELLNCKIAEVKTLKPGLYNYLNNSVDRTIDIMNKAKTTIVSLILFACLTVFAYSAVNLTLSSGGDLKNTSGVALYNVSVEPIGEGQSSFTRILAPGQNIVVPYKQFSVTYTLSDPNTGRYYEKKERFINKSISEDSQPQSETKKIMRLDIDYKTDDSFWYDAKTYMLFVRTSEPTRVTVLDSIPMKTTEKEADAGNEIDYGHRPADMLCLGLATKKASYTQPAIFFLEPEREKAYYLIYFEIEKDNKKRIGRQTVKSPVFVSTGQGEK